MTLTGLSLVILLVAGLAVAEIKNIGWWNNTVFYQIYPRSFKDSDNDGIGDLKGITSKLEHFVESGIGGIWLSPIFVSPMIDFGYDIADFREIDSIFGSLKDLNELTQKAKKLGLKVILDFVPNHTSDKHEWFVKSVQGLDKYKDYYVWRKGRKNNTEPPNNWLNSFSGSAWTYNNKRDLWYLHQFDHRQVDLNYSNPDVLEELDAILQFWLSKGIDGFRIDSVNFLMENDDLLDEPPSNMTGVMSHHYDYNDHIHTKNDPRNYNFICRWRKLVDDWADLHNTDEKLIMVEAYCPTMNATKFYDYGAHVPFNFDLLTDIDENSKPSDYKKIIERWMSLMPKDAIPNWVVGNHDRRRLNTRFLGKADQMTMLTMILPGVAVTYYGEEIGMADYFNISWEATQDPQACNADKQSYQKFTRDPCRTPFQWDDTKNSGFSNASSTWLPVHDNFKDLNLKKQKSTPQSYYKLYQTLTKLKSISDALRFGDLRVEVLNEGKVLAVIRKTIKESIACLISFTNDTCEMVNVAKYFPSVKKATIITASVRSKLVWGSKIKTSKVRLPPNGSLVLRVKI